MVNFFQEGNRQLKREINGENYVISLQPFNLSEKKKWTLITISKYDHILEKLLLKNEKKFIYSLIRTAIIFIIALLLLIAVINIMKKLFRI